MVASMYAVYHGPEGLERIARRVASYTAILARGLAELGAPLREAPSFDTLSLHTGAATQAIVERAVSLGANLRVYFKEYLCISLDETTTRADVELLWKIFARDGQALPSFTAFERAWSR